MSAGVALYNILSNNAGVTAIVGTSSNCRIYPLIQNQNYQIPAIVYSEISTIPNATKSGVSTMDESLMQLDIIANTKAEAVTLANAARTALDYNRGSFGGVVVGQITFEQQRDSWNEFTKTMGAAVIQVDYRLFIAR